jgi:predicted PurR-regulated permease PerM
MLISLLAVLIITVALLAALGLGLNALSQIRQLRRELDETQRQLNELKAAAEVVAAPPPPLPRTRSADLDDLRQQLREAHRAPDESASE